MVFFACFFVIRFSASWYSWVSPGAFIAAFNEGNGDVFGFGWGGWRGTREVDVWVVRVLSRAVIGMKIGS